MIEVVAISKYITDEHQVNHCGTIFTVVNNTPNIHKEDRDEQKREIEDRLYSIFSKYQPS